MSTPNKPPAGQGGKPAQATPKPAPTPPTGATPAEPVELDGEAMAALRLQIREEERAKLATEMAAQAAEAEAQRREASKQEADTRQQQALNQLTDRKAPAGYVPCLVLKEFHIDRQHIHGATEDGLSVAVSPDKNPDPIYLPEAVALSLQARRKLRVTRA